ncbi:hypothetical protein GCM10028803_07570 [Larkinella knui]
MPITEQQKTDEQVEAFARFKDIEQDGLSFVTLEMLKYRALVEAKAFNRLENVSKSCHNQMLRTPPGEITMAYFFNSFDTRS